MLVAYALDGAGYRIVAKLTLSADTPERVAVPPFEAVPIDLGMLKTTTAGTLAFAGASKTFALPRCVTYAFKFVHRDARRLSAWRLATRSFLDGRPEMANFH